MLLKDLRQIYLEINVSRSGINGYNNTKFPFFYVVYFIVFFSSDNTVTQRTWLLHKINSTKNENNLYSSFNYEELVKCMKEWQFNVVIII
jgi:hypothetical protein